MRSGYLLICSALFLFCTFSSIHIKAQCQSVEIVQDKQGGCPPTTISFELKGAGPEDAVVWIINKKDSIYAEARLQHIFSKLGDYEIEAELRKKGGDTCRTAVPAKVKITSGPQINGISASRNTLCAPDTVTLRAAASGAVQYDWIIEGVNYTDAGPVVTHKFNTPGYHNITLRVKDELGCYVMRSFNSVVYMKYYPVAKIISDVPGGCVPFKTDFKAEIVKGESPVTSYEWHFENADNSFSSQADPAPVTYSKAGDWDVTLKIKTADGCSYTFRKDNAVRAGQPVEMSFEADTVVKYVGDTFHIANTSEQGVGRFRWEAIDARVLYEDGKELKTVYYAPGLYSINLYYEHGSCRQELKKTAYLKVVTKDTISNKYPCYKFRANWNLPRVFCVNEPVKAYGNAHNYKNARVKWTAGPDIIFLPSDTAYNPTVIARKAGKHTISYHLTNDIGCEDHMEIVADVFDPEISFTSADTVNSCAPAYVRFRVMATDADSFFWYFGDGSYLATTSTEIAHLYQMNSGQQNDKGFDVMVVAKNNNGCTDTMLRKNYIKVLGPVPSFVVTSATKGTGQLEVSFRNTSKYVHAYYFDYGDNTPFDSNTINNHTYKITDPGKAVQSFKPRLLVKDDYGCASVYELPDSIVVYRKPEADFKPSEERSCENVRVEFTNTSQYATKWYWDLDGDGIIDDTSRNATYIYKPGEYNPMLIAENILGYKDTFVYPQAIEIYPKPIASFTSSAEAVCPGSTVSFSAMAGEPGQTFEWSIDGEPLPSAGNHFSQEFSAPGRHEVLLTTSNTAGCRDTIRKYIYVMDDKAPVPAEILAVSNEQGGISINWQKPDEPGIKKYYLYRINAGDTTLIKITADGHDSTYFDAAGDNGAGYFMTTEDICGLISKPSVVHKPISLEVSPEENKGLRLEWTPYIGWKSAPQYEIYRIDRETGKKIKLTTVAGETTYLDRDICNIEYCYIVVAVNSMGISAKSNSACAKVELSTFATEAELRTVSVNGDNTIIIRWEAADLPKLKSYLVERKATDGKWETIGYTRDIFWTDTKAEPGQRSYFYRISVLDSCGNIQQFSNTGQSIMLKAEQGFGKTNLQWNHYKEWPEGIKEYRLERAENGIFREAATLSPTSLSYTDAEGFDNTSGEICYRIYAVRKGLKQDSSYSNIVCITPPSSLHVPNAFSPNGDGLNDEFKVFGTALMQLQGLRSDYRINIYDRWGANVFSSKDVNQGWDGTLDGKQLEAGTYSYTIYGVGYDGQHYSREGTIHLMR